MTVLDRLIHWKKLILLDTDGETPLNVPAEKIVALLAEFRDTGSLAGVFFAPVGHSHEDEEDASTWGPLSPDHVDWTEFPAMWKAYIGADFMGQGATKEEAIEAAVEEYERSIGYGDEPHMFTDKEALIAALDVAEE